MHLTGGSQNPPLPPEPGSDEQDAALIEAVAKRIVAMGLAAPAVFFLESTKPLSYIGSQALVFLEPFVKSVLNLRSYDRFTAMLEDRKNIEKLMLRIEDLDDTARDEEKARKAALKAEKQGAKVTGVERPAPVSEGPGARQPGGRPPGGRPPGDDRGWFSRLFRRGRGDR